VTEQCINTRIQPLFGYKGFICHVRNTGIVDTGVIVVNG